MKGHSCITC